ncbi:MAG: prepilin-type N-terminal cleavage/methylation domain-containing protein [Desulfobacterales bacterium]|nr:prepilin-type N-terminal cleavage/methylation domain-containing protein [Desulfobacterales bacterium]MBF0399050.1 prepilin-type N-terminal cleavage/methylation domain-containing protein [Desulfobacterales bacterium]
MYKHIISRFNILQSLRNKKGFTLIELIIVVAIIGVLAAIAIPNFRAYQFKAKRSEAPVNLKSIRAAEEAYRAENGKYIALIASPVTVSNTGPIKHRWIDNGGFSKIGWQPTGDVYASYYTPVSVTVSQTVITCIAATDVDGNGTRAMFIFDQDNDVSMLTANSVY